MNRLYLPGDQSYADTLGRRFTVVGGRTLHNGEPFTGEIVVESDTGTQMRLTKMVDGWPSITHETTAAGTTTWFFEPPGYFKREKRHRAALAPR